MKPMRPRAQLLSYALLAILASSTGTTAWWLGSQQQQWLATQDGNQDNLPWFYSDFSSQYYQLRHQFDRVLLTHGSEVEIVQLRQKFNAFSTLSRQLQENENNELQGAISPEKNRQLRRVVTQLSVLFESKEKQIFSEEAFRKHARALDEMQELVTQLALNISRIHLEQTKRQTQALQHIFWAENLLITLLLLLGSASAIFYFRKLRQTQQLRNERDLLLTQIGHSRFDMEAFNLERQEFLASLNQSLSLPLQKLIQEIDSTEHPSPEQCSTLRTRLHQLRDEVSDLLELSALEAGLGALEYADFDLHQLLSRTTNAMMPECRAKGLLLLLETTTDVPILLHGNAARIRQILQTLISNAIKHTTSGRIRVNAYTVGRRGGTNRLRIDVSDTGSGIDPAILPQIFQGGTQHRDGFYHGVRIARILARHMEGDLSAASRPHEGSTFTLDLPLRAADQALAEG